MLSKIYASSEIDSSKYIKLIAQFMNRDISRKRAEDRVVIMLLRSQLREVARFSDRLSNIVNISIFNISKL